MKKILIINPFSGKIGPNSFLVHLLNYSSAHNYSVTLIYPKYDDFYHSIKNKCEENYFLSYIELKPINNLFKKLIKRFFSELRLLFFLNTKLKVSEYSFVLINTEIYSFSLKAFYKKTNIFTVVHTLNFSNQSLVSRFVLKTQNYFVTEYIAVSKKVKELLIKNGNYKPISILHNVIDTKKSVYTKSHRNNYFTITCVSYPIESKGAHYLVEIINILIKKFKFIKFIVIGWESDIINIEYKNRIEKLIKLHDLSTYIELKPLVPSVIPYMQESDLFIQVSENEAFGIVVAEAMSCQLPVVAFNVGALSELIESNRNGYLIDPFDSISFSQKIDQLLEDQILRMQFGENGFKKVSENYSFQSFSENLHTVISKYH